MPSSPGYKRNYKQESRTAKRRGENVDNKYRKRARRKLEKAGVVRPFDGKDVDHKNGSPRNNSRSNLRVKTSSSNRSFPRTKTAGKKKIVRRK